MVQFKGGRSEFIYPWDYLDNMVFLLFLYGVIRDKGDGFFGALFLAALLNRESALFVPLWMVLDGAWPNGRSGMCDGLPRSAGKRRALWGIILLLGGALIIHLLRRQLLVRELGPDLFTWFAAERPYHLLTSLQGILQAVKEPLPELNLLMHSLLFLTPLFFFLVRRRIDQKLAKLGVIVSIMVATILVSGLIDEPRTLNILIPFAVLLPLYHFHLKGR